MVGDGQEYPDNFDRGYFQEYVLQNNGNTAHTVRFGVWYQYESEMPSELFRINGVRVRHIVGDGKEVYGSSYFAFIDVDFPAHERVAIRVDELSSLMKSEGMDNHTILVYPFTFNGNPHFTATIGNRRIDRIDRPYFEIEDWWIRDILFNDVTKTGKISLLAILEQEGSLANDFFVIQKTNGNTWNIAFSEQFVTLHRSYLTFKIDWGWWGWTHPLSNSMREWHLNIEEPMSPYQYIFLTNRQLRVLRNAIFARHGFVFTNHNLQRMFEELRNPDFGNINYQPNPDFTEAMLTETDRANIATIQRLEALAGN
jgi:hypothetical protein